MAESENQPPEPRIEPLDSAATTSSTSTSVAPAQAAGVKAQLQHALARARQQRAELDPAFDHYLGHARAACKLARSRLPWEDFARRDSWVVALELYRVAAGWTLAALLDRAPGVVERELREQPAPDWATALTGIDDGALVTTLFAEVDPAEPVESLRRRCRRARGVVEQLLRHAERRRVAPRRLLGLYAARRWLAAALAATALALPVGLLLIPGHPFAENIALGRRWQASSALASYGKTRGVIREDQRHFFFHTDEESSPWLRIELPPGATVSGVTLRNRQDCCGFRALPLVVELSPDGKHYEEVARRAESFDSWSPSFERKQARYLRVRVDRTSTLHLKAVEVFR